MPQMKRAAQRKRRSKVVLALDLEHIDRQRRAAAVMQVELQRVAHADGDPLQPFPPGLSSETRGRAARPPDSD